MRAKDSAGETRFKKKCSRGLMGNVFGEAPNTAGEGARAPRASELCKELLSHYTSAV